MKTKEERKTPISGVDCYFTEGFSVKFFREFDKYAAWLHLRYCKNTVDSEEYVDSLKMKTTELLLANIFDPTKTKSLASFIHSLGRNLASAFNSKFSRLDPEEFLESHVVTDEDTGTYAYIDDFISLANSRGVEVDKTALLHDIHNECNDAPLVMGYLWYLIKRRREG